MNHTSGPWKTKDINLNGCTPVFIGPYLENGKSGGCLIASCTGDRENALANAHLIAAAPDMYDALKGLVSLLEADDPVTVGCHCTATNTGYGDLICPWCRAQAALAKADGRESNA